jgi:hypothetical protein
VVLGEATELVRKTEQAVASVVESDNQDRH